MTGPLPIPTVAQVASFLTEGWGLVLTAIAVAMTVSRFDLFGPVARFLWSDAPSASQRIAARLAEVAVWLTVPLAVATQVDLEAMFGAGLGAVFVAYLVRKPLKDYLSAFVTAAKVAANERLHPGVRAKFNGPGVEGVIEDIDTEEVHVRLDNGNVTHVPNGDVVGNRWTTINDGDDSDGEQ